MPKPDVTLHPADIEALPWVRPAGAVEGVAERILTIDPATGSATRLLKVDPYVDTGIFRHDHWEEVWMLEGSYKMGPEFHPTGTYTCKGPYVDHGPFITNDGYLGLEVRDFLPPAMDKPRATLLPIDIERLVAEPIGTTEANAHEEWWVFRGDARCGDLVLEAGTYLSRSPGWETGALIATTDYVALEIRNRW
jgi:hypothetical protein